MSKNNKVPVSNALADLKATGTKALKEFEKAHNAEVAESAAHDAEKLVTCEKELAQLVKKMLKED